MRVVLEMQDLLEILGAHLGHEVTHEQVRIRTEPVFELEVAGAVSVSDMRPKPAAPLVGKNTREQVKNVLARNLPPDSYVEDGDGESLQDLIAYSREMEKTTNWR